MKAALKSASEEEDRSQNLVIYGLPEKSEEILEKRVLEVLENIDEKPRIVSCCRMGRTVSDGGPAVKPIKFTLSGSDHVRRVLSKARKLREVEGYDSVYISPDRSAEQRAAFRKTKCLALSRALAIAVARARLTALNKRARSGAKAHGIVGIKKTAGYGPPRVCFHIINKMKSSAGKSRSFQRTKVNHETSGKMQKHRSRDKISRAVKRFVLSDKDKNAQLGDDEEEVCHENNSQSTEIDSGNDIETQKSTETKPKKNMKKRASVAILVGKFESEVRAVRSKVSRVKLLNRASLDCGADSQKVQLASVSLPPAPVLHRATHSTSSTEPEDREVEFIFSSSGYNQGSDEELLFVPRGFNSNRLLRRKKAQRRKDFRGWTKSENGSPNMPRSVPDVISPSKPSPDMTV
ncbi:uncharacterized protein LOC134823644 [Bolinopsis microptera]|uniref:uncharacterized protein LOC134823644 n=1 Tax=Bolinopsis microptera TaxID=2820187 RepID=UPI00307A5E1C